MERLNTQAQKAILRMADGIRDLNAKLDYLIRKQTEDYMGANHRRSSNGWRK